MNTLSKNDRALGRAVDDARDVAVIGMACRFPGAADPEAFWRSIVGGGTAIREVPADRWDVDRYYDPTGTDPAGACSRWGGFLDDLAHFDEGFFRISPREAKSLDPQHRLLLETSVEALEHAGQPVDGLKGSRTGVFVGICNTEYAALTGAADDYSLIDKYFGTGTAISVAAGRIAYTLDLHGPAIAVDTACSSSLVAVHMAVASLRAGESELCLAGGVNVALSPSVGIYFSQLGAVSRSPECRPFDDAADGYVRGEGCGMVALKLLSRARQDGDRVLAVVRGSAVNQDGRSAGLTAPNGAAQEAVLRQALDDAGVRGGDIVFAETHGTGTRLGDPIEAGALGRVYGRAPGRDGPLHLGAVKATIGHLESAAGIAGLVKAVQAVVHGQVPPQAGFSRPNGMIDFEALGLDVPTAPRPWPVAGGLASVSSFGFSGTNAHLILGPPPAGASVSEPAAPESAVPDTPAAPLILPLSARDDGALGTLAESLAERLAGGADAAALCRGMALRRSHYARRRCVVGADAPALIAALGRAAAAVEPPDPSARRGPAWVFSGQGGQWAGMGAALSRFPAAAARFDAIDAALADRTDWSVRAAMDRPETLEAPRIVTSQVAIFAVQAGLAAVFEAWGLRPAAVVGHSMGEVAAAVAAGALTLAQGAVLVFERSTCLADVAGRGAMALVDASSDTVGRTLDALGSDVTIAAVNGPSNVVVSGRQEAVAEVVDALTERGIFARTVNTDGVPGHSPLIASVGDAVRARVGALAPAATTVPFYSAVAGADLDGEGLTAAYWARNVVEPVRFDRAFSALVDDGYRDFVEIGPRPVLLPAMRDALTTAGTPGLAVASLTPPDARAPKSPESAVAALYARGHDPDWARIMDPSAPWSPPPRYPWQRRYHWITELRAAAPDRPGSPARSTEGAASEQPPAAALATILRHHDRHGLRSLNMGHLAPRLWLAENDTVAVWAVRSGPVLLVWALAGDDAACRAAVDRLRRAAADAGLTVVLVLPETAASRFETAETGRLDFGLTHWIDLADFDPSRPGYRRLRSRLARYAADPTRRTRFYRPGADPEVDRRLARIVRGWRAAKGRAVPAADDLLAEIGTGRLPPHRRLMIAEDGDEVQALIVLTAFAAGDGWLLDMEFYEPTTPPGCTERLIVDAARALAAEGAAVLSLGGSYRLPDLADATDPSDGAAAAYRKQVQYKAKFNPRTEPVVLLGADSLDRPALDALWLAAAGLAADEAVTTRDPAAFLAGGGREVVETGARRLGPALPLAGPVRVHEATCSSADPLLAEHRLHGTPVWPAAASIDLVVAALRPSGETGGVRLGDLRFERPLFVDPGREAAFQVHVDRTAGAATVYGRIADRADDDWQCLMRCRIGSPVPSPDPVPVSADARPVDVDAMYRDFGARGIAYGGPFRRLGAVAVAADGSIRARIVPPGDGVGRGDAVDPTALDAALQALSAGGQEQGAALMLHSIETLIVHRSLPDVATMAARSTEIGNQGAAADVDILDPDGTPVLSARGVFARPAGTAGASIEVAELAYRPAAEPAGVAWRHGAVRVIGTDALAAACADAFAAGGAPTTTHQRVDAGNDRADGATHLVLAPRIESADDAAGVIAGLGRFLRVWNGPGSLAVWVVTRGRVDPGPACPGIGATLAGAARVLRSEHPELGGGLIDVDADLDAAAAGARIARLVADPGEEDDWHLSREGMGVARLGLRRLTGAEPFRPRSDRSYVVTGWTGGLGRALVARLIDRGAGAVVAIARGAGDAAARSALEARAEAAGCTLSLVRGDVTDPDAVADLAAVARRRAPIGGAFHAVGCLNDGLLIGQNDDAIARTLGVEWGGAVSLAAATAGDNLDTFVVFSSAASLLGPPAQAPHAAAAAGLDALARSLRTRGVPALAVGWGPWQTVGRAADQGHDRRIDTFGMRGLGVEEGLSTLETLIAAGLTHAHVAPIDWARFAEAAPAMARRPVFRELVPAQSDAADDERTPASVAMRPDAGLGGAPGLLDDLLDAAAATLLVDVDALDPGKSLEANGLDSIMIVELREALGDRQGAVFPLIEFFRAPDLETLATTLAAAR